MIARCADAADVATALRFARAEGLEPAVRAGGHSVGGFSSPQDGLVIDLTRIRYVQVDPEARTARVGGGATAGDLDHATHAFGLATPAATVSTVGVAGFTLERRPRLSDARARPRGRQPDRRRRRAARRQLRARG